MSFRVVISRVIYLQLKVVLKSQLDDLLKLHTVLSLKISTFKKSSLELRKSTFVTIYEEVHRETTFLLKQLNKIIAFQ